MTRWAPAFVLLGLIAASAARAEAPDECNAPDYVTHPEGKLAHVGPAIARDKRLDVLVVGTGSSALAGPGGAAAAYPARLEAALKRRLPGVEVTLRTDVANRRTAADTIRSLERDIAERKPTLVIWQTGTVDAMRGVDPDDFRAALDKGLGLLGRAGADAVFMNMQYSPRTEAMIAADAYADALRLAAQQNDVPLFDRLALMKHWSEAGFFDLTSPDQPQVAGRVHGCIGTLLAAMIVDLAALSSPRSKSGG